MYHIYDCVLFSVYLEILSRMIKALDLNIANIKHRRVFVPKSFSFLSLLCLLLFLLRFSLSVFLFYVSFSPGNGVCLL